MPCAFRAHAPWSQHTAHEIAKRDLTWINRRLHAHPVISASCFFSFAIVAATRLGIFDSNLAKVSIFLQVLASTGPLPSRRSVRDAHREGRVARPLHTALFLETGPAPVKYALSVLGKCPETLRLPLIPVAEPTRCAVREAMIHAGLVN